MKQVYLILAAMMLLCLAPMPYGYYMLVRFVAMVVFCLMAYRYYSRNKAIAACVFGVLALLFQPIYKIALGRMLWNMVDVLVAALLIALFFLERRLEKKGSVGILDSSHQGHMALEDNTMEFAIHGRLAPGELVYVASEEDKTLTDLFESHPEVLEGWGMMIGFHIVYLPLLIKKLKDRRVLQYRAPYLSDAELAEAMIGLSGHGRLPEQEVKNDFLLQYLENPADRGKIGQGFIRTEDVHRGDDGKDRATNRFYPLSTASGEPLADQLHRIGKQIAAEKQRHDRYLESKSQGPGDGGGVADNALPPEQDFSRMGEDVSTDDLLDEVRERIARLRQRGIAEYVLEQLIHPDNRLSRMVITKDWRILLPDYNNMEIKMEPLVKAVYLLFLRHEEGIAFKQLPAYREELTELYNALRPSGLTDRAKQSIEDVTNPVMNSINEKCARIRGAFLGLFDDYMAKSYYIDGQRGETKKISLSRDLITWE